MPVTRIQPLDSAPITEILGYAELPLEAVAHPALCALLDRWEAARGDGMVPSRAAMAPETVHQALGAIAILEPVAGPPATFRYRLFGTAIVARYGHDMTGLTIEASGAESLREALRAHAAAAVERRRPVHYRVSAVRNAMAYDYLKLVLPLSEDGMRISQIIGATFPVAPGPEGPFTPSAGGRQNVHP